MFKGHQTPVHVYSVLDENRTPVAVHREGGLTSQLVGRKLEFPSFFLGLEVSRETERVICINGEAG
jgi:hypothetical protein